MSLKYFPIALAIKNKRVIVIGAGKVAERKILNFLKADACISVIAPFATSHVKKLAKENRIKWLPREVRKSDIDKALLVVSATNKAALNKHISSWARKKKIHVNVVDNPGISDYISQAILRFRKTLITVYTDAEDPRLSRDLKNYLKEKWHDFLSYRDRL